MITAEDYNKLLNDNAFKALDSRLNEVNFFRILKKETDELSHSNFLSWFSDPFCGNKLVWI